jgi:hypothetical protein
MISAPRSGFKVLIGFDVLVVVRPVENPARGRGSWTGNFLTLKRMEISALNWSAETGATARGMLVRIWLAQSSTPSSGTEWA